MNPWIAAKADNLGARRDQQDRVAVLNHPRRQECLILVADGVGGQEGGALASQAVVETAGKLWRAGHGQPVPPRDFLMQLCQLSHKEIVRIGKEKDVAPRATIAAVYIANGEANWVHSGDSRVYQFRERNMVGRTRDHSVLQILVERGAVKEEEMGTHPDQGKLLQSLGGDEFKQPTFGTGKAAPGDGYLVCTDGFWERITPQEAGALVASGHELPKKLKYAVDLAAQRGGPKGDNVSAAAIAICGRRGFVALIREYALVVISVAVALLLLLVSVSINRRSRPSTSNPAAASEASRAEGIAPSAIPKLPGDAGLQKGAQEPVSGANIEDRLPNAISAPGSSTAPNDVNQSKIIDDPKKLKEISDKASIGGVSTAQERQGSSTPNVLDDSSPIPEKGRETELAPEKNVDPTPAPATHPKASDPPGVSNGQPSAGQSRPRPRATPEPPPMYNGVRRNPFIAPTPKSSNSRPNN